MVAPVAAYFRGLVLRRQGGILPDLCHWVRIPTPDGHLYRLSGLRVPPDGEDLTRFATALLAPSPGADWLELRDKKRGVLRVGIVRDGVLEACLFLARELEGLPNEAAVIPMLAQPVPDSARLRLLAGRPNDTIAAEGPRVCACFGVSRDAVRHAAVTHRLRSVAEIGVVLRAGTNCGSCIPELEEILRDVRMPAG